MRIIAGSARGKRLKVPERLVRPTADRVKESLFNRIGPWLDGESVLDLFAGSGNLALEALSRGATRACLVEQSPQVLPILRENIRALGFDSAAEVMSLPVSRALAQLKAREERFSLIFIDPPYQPQVLASVLEAADNAQLLLPEGRLIAEHDRRELLPSKVGGLVLVDERRFGDTVLSFYERE